MSFSTEQTKPDACGRRSPFSPNQSSFPPGDKGFAVSKPGVGDFDEYFAQYISSQSSVTKDWVNPWHGSDLFGLPGDGGISSSGSNDGDHGLDHSIFPDPQQHSKYLQASLRGTQSHETFPSYQHQRFARFEKPKAAISGHELLNLEGRVPPQSLPIRSFPSSSSKIAAIPPLRRKARFGGVPEISRSSNHSRHELPWVNDCKQRFEQMSGISTSPRSPVATSIAIRDAKRRPESRYAGLEESSLRHIARQANPHRGGNGVSETLTPIPPQHSMEWHHFSGSTDSLGFLISAEEPNSDRPSNLAHTYYDNVEASQSAPALAQARSDLSDLELMFGNQFTQPVLSRQASGCCSARPMGSVSSTGSDSYPSSSNPGDSFTRYPSPPLTWTCPPPSFRPKSPTRSPPKQRGRSKSNRRKPSTSVLRSPTSLDFVNYTPNDSHKILSSVAPSGSSKTKARREQEALEKKKKLALIAEQAIMDAGGDVEQLRASGLFALWRKTNLLINNNSNTRRLFGTLLRLNFQSTWHESAWYSSHYQHSCIVDQSPWLS